MTNKDKVKGFYEQEAIDYDSKRWVSLSGKYINLAHQNTVLDLLGNCEGKRVLEIGVGTGRFTRILKEKGALVVALDIAMPMLKIARKITDKAGGEATTAFVGADIRKMPFKDNFFDMCLGINVFSHLRMCKKGFQEISRVLNPEGVLVANIPNWLSYYLPYGVMVNVLRKSLHKGVYARWYSLPEITSYCRSAGLKVETIRGHTVFPFNSNSSLVVEIVKLVDSLAKYKLLSLASPAIFFKCLKQKEKPYNYDKK